MLTFDFVGSSAEAANYYEETDDYYTKPGHRGEWDGEGAKALGLEGGVDRQIFMDLLDGRLPDGRQARKSMPHTQKDGSKSAPRLGIDFTFNAPKSVSIVALVKNDRRVIEAHDAAVKDALAMMESRAIARQKYRGISFREKTGKLIVAKFQHDLSRDQDPHLHTHAVTMNLTQRRDGRWVALANEDMLKSVKVVGAYYRAQLAQYLTNMGYDIRATRNGFEMASVPDEAIKLFSQRSRTIEEELAKSGLTRETATGELKQNITKDTRAEKTDANRAALRQEWANALAAAGIDLGPMMADHEAAPVPDTKFVTAEGDTYIVHPDGTTTRDEPDAGQGEPDSPQSQPTSPEAEQSAIPTPAAPDNDHLAQLAVTGFATAKGSTYTVHEDGTTTRDKAARADVGHEGDSGIKPRTDRTVYVENDASRLSAAGLNGLDEHGARVVIKDGKATLLTWNERGNRWGASPSSRDVPVFDKPAVGLYPLELWKLSDDVPGYEAYRGMHAGNKITELRHDGPAPDRVAQDDESPAQHDESADAARADARPADVSKPAPTQPAALAPKRAEHTFYVTERNAETLAYVQTRGEGKRIVRMDDGKYAVAYTTGNKAGEVDPRTVVDASTRPAAGLVPVELWENGGRVRFGSRIASIEQPKPIYGREKSPAPGDIRLYRGEGGTLTGSVPAGNWWTTNPAKAARYGDVFYVDLPREFVGNNFAQGHNGTDEYFFAGSDETWRTKVRPLGDSHPMRPSSATDEQPTQPAGQEQETNWLNGIQQAGQRIFDAVRGKGKGDAANEPPTPENAESPMTPQEVARNAVDFAIEHLSERQGIFTKSEILERAYMRSLGATEEVNDELANAVEDGRLVAELPLFQSAKSFSRDVHQQTIDPHFDKFRHDNDIHKLTKESWVSLLVNVEGYSPERAQRTVEESIRNGRLVETEQRFTTREMRQTESEILWMERTGRGTVEPLRTAEQAEAMLASTGLNPGQKEAAQLVLTSPNRFIGIQGYAGVGKSHLMSTVVQEIKMEAAQQAETLGYKVVGLAPYGSQNKALQELGMESQTLASFLVREPDPELLGPKTIIFLDEASVVSAHQMKDLMARVEQSGARLVMIGDRKQTQAVEAGKPFEQLQDGGMALAHVTEIQRQKDATLKAAVEKAANNNIGGSVKLLEKNTVQLKKEKARHGRLADDYVKMPEEQRDGTLIVVGTNETRRKINELVRDKLKLPEGELVRALESYDMSRAEHKQASSYQQGVVLIAERPGEHGLDRGVHYTVRSADARGNTLTVSDAAGNVRSLDATHLSGVSTYTLTDIPIVKGDWLRITRNDNRQGVFNGERHRVLSVDKDSVVLENGAKLSRASAIHAQHGYAQTVHSAQGLTRHGVLIEADTRSLTSNRAVWYVAISRAQHALKIYTDDAGGLARVMAREPKKYAALELRDERREKVIFDALSASRTLQQQSRGAVKKTLHADATKPRARPTHQARQSHQRSSRRGPKL